MLIEFQNLYYYSKKERKKERKKKKEMKESKYRPDADQSQNVVPYSALVCAPF